MSRDIDPDDRQPDKDQHPQTEPSRTRSKEDRVRTPVQDQDRTFHISPDERETLRDIGKFRVLAVEDLTRYRYQENAQQLKEDLKDLERQGLVRCRTLWMAKDGEKVKLITLTKQGERLTRNDVGRFGQEVYSGFVKRAEIAHDTAIYRAYQTEAVRIEKEGGRIRRVVLDFELKRLVYTPLAKIRPQVSPGEYRKRQAEVAQQNGLKVIGGRVRLPDLRIEYETRDGQQARVDLEVASSSYHGSHAAIKAAAGFKIYGSAETASRLSRNLEERDIVAEILSI